MAKNDLSSAINLVSQLPEIKYSEIGTLTNQLETMGYDQKTAKMAIIMVFKENPQVKSLTKSAGVNALQAAKSMFEANMEIGDILDKLLDMGYLKTDAVEAIDALDLNEEDQEVNQFTDVSSEKDNAFSDYADEGYEYDDIPPKALQAILNQVNNNKDEVNEDFVREVLESYDVSANSISQLNRELFARESSTMKKSVELSWRDIGLAMQDSSIDKDQIITILKANGASEEEAAAAALPREGQEGEEEGGPGALSDAPEDLDLGPGEDLPYGAGMDLEGPGGLNDGLEGAPGPNDFSGTGGGYMEAPDDVSGGDFFNDAPSGAGGESAGEEGDSYLQDLAQDYIENDPQMTRGDIVEILKNEGADKQEANQVADKLNLEDDSAIKPGVFVRAGVGTGRVVSVWETMYGKMANVLSDSDGKEYEFQVQDIERIENEKNSHTDELFDKIATHLNGEWFDSLGSMSEDYRDTYSSRIKEARALQNEINVRLGSSKDIGEMGILEESRDALTHEIVFCQTRLASNEFIGEQEYVNSLPKYEFAKEASLGNDLGPGGGESIAFLAEEMDKEASSEDWDEILRVESVDFVNNLSTTSVGDAQEVAKMAFDHFSPRVAGVEGERKFEIISEFMSNVEKVRRAVVADIKTADFSENDVLLEELENLISEYKNAGHWSHESKLIYDKIWELIQAHPERPELEEIWERFDQGKRYEQPDDPLRFAAKVSSDEKEDYPWDKCIQDQLDAGHDMESAKKICGSIKAKNASVEENSDEGWLL